MDKKVPKILGKTLNIKTLNKREEKDFHKSSRACVVTTFVRGGALSRVAAPLCLGCRAIGNEEEEEEKSEKKKPRVHRTEARALVCVWTEEDTTEDDQHTKRFQFVQN